MAYAFNNDKSKSELDNAMFITAETNSITIYNNPPVGSIFIGRATAPTKSGYTPISVVDVSCTLGGRIDGVSLFEDVVSFFVQNTGGSSNYTCKATVLYVATKYIRQ